MAKRVEWIDIVKFVSIMFVMASHLESMTNEFFMLYSPIYLTLFSFSSGYVYKHINGFKNLLLKKMRQLFIPWLIFSLFNILLAQVFSFNNHDGILTELKWNFLQIRGLNDGMWYVAALFVAYIPFYFFVKWYEKNDRKRTVLFIFLSFLLSLMSIMYANTMNPEYLPWNTVNLPWHLEYIFQAMFYMYLGYLFRTAGYEDRFEVYNTKISRTMLIIFYIILIYFIPICEDKLIVKVTYNYVCEFVGIITVIFLCKAIKSNKYIAYIGGNSLICFGLHGKLLSVIQVVLRKTVGGFYSHILNNTLKSSVFSMILTVVISVLLIIPIWIINNYFPYLIGRKRGTRSN